ncbi:L-rhamnose-binding lectin CSL3-like [Strongylocentrotus purpuratus]|uniref:SUEL-type lectin domain-containing protein n=1 Tax=Strongylocentrotus purpuratus TaxID=7668 RepID=A0A7M7NDW3_STRPU|nr:L-rhamnose-binding lectin CSL3-like [Strongylocentrotus purpuratus]
MKPTTTDTSTTISAISGTTKPTTTDTSTTISATTGTTKPTTTDTSTTISAITGTTKPTTTDTSTTISATTGTTKPTTTDTSTTFSPTTGTTKLTTTDTTTVLATTGTTKQTTTDTSTTISATTSTTKLTTTDTSTTVSATTGTTNPTTTENTRVTQIVCEGDTSLIYCAAGVIIIHTASYGRTDESTCQHLEYNGNTDCDNDEYIVLNQCCFGRERCIVYAHNDIFSDPCPAPPYTTKYLNVTYTCMAESVNTETDIFIVCEGFSDVIDCGSDIITINSAIYGRTDLTTCQYCTSDPLVANICFSATSDQEQILSSSCDGLHSCTVIATNEIFGYSCPDTYKYLAVEYECT